MGDVESLYRQALGRGRSPASFLRSPCGAPIVLGVRTLARYLVLSGIVVGLAYGLFVAALGRRFGPEWPEPAPASGATGAFLQTIAGIHDRLGHHRDAAQALRDRAHEVLGVAITPLEAPAADGAGALMEVARRIHAKQKEGRTP